MQKKNIWLPLLFLVILIILSACEPASGSENLDAASQVEDVVDEMPTLEPTPVPEKNLVICVGQEPSTLYPYGSSSRSMWSILEAIYDGPIDTSNFSAQPVILSEIPSYENGHVILQAVDVQKGDEIIDANGDLVILDTGSIVMPAGCTNPLCAVPWDGNANVQLNQTIIKYSLLPDVNWSDGTQLTASDSVFSYNIAVDKETPVSKWHIDRTFSYTALDDQTVEWIGVPGYIPQDFSESFYQPFPEHLWKDFSASELLTANESTRSPIGWGPYTIEDWVAGDHITLKKNQNYFRIDEGLPKFDNLVFRFLGEPADNNIAAVLIGECDVVDQTTLLEDQLEPILELQQDNKLKAYIGQGLEWEHLDFGIKPSSYDAGYNGYIDRPDYFSDVRVRQAITYCIDREGIIDDLLYGQSSIPVSYLAPTHPLYPELGVIPYDTNQGSLLLDEIGWKNLDGDPSTPRVSQGVENVPDGTELILNYATSKAPLREEVAKRIASSLEQCGIRLNVQYYDISTLYAPGPDGLLFGRNFDLAQYAWEAGKYLPCFLYETEQIPTEENGWLSVNITGYSNPLYDNACQIARLTHPAQYDVYSQAYKNVQELFAQELPVIPLFYRIRMAISRPDLCGFEMDVSTRSVLWNLESYDYGESCQ